MGSEMCIRDSLDIDRDGRIEVREDKNQNAIADGIWPGAPSEEVSYCLHPSDMDELCKSYGKHENRGSKDDRDNASLIDLER